METTSFLENLKRTRVYPSDLQFNKEENDLEMIKYFDRLNQSCTNEHKQMNWTIVSWLSSIGMGD